MIATHKGCEENELQIAVVPGILKERLHAHSPIHLLPHTTEIQESLQSTRLDKLMLKHPALLQLMITRGQLLKFSCELS